MSTTESTIIEATEIHEAPELFDVKLTRPEIELVAKFREYNSAKSAWNSRWINEPKQGDPDGR